MAITQPRKVLTSSPSAFAARPWSRSFPLVPIRLPRHHRRQAGVGCPGVNHWQYNKGRIQGAFAMPVHDWTRVDAGIFHAFHLNWLGRLQDALNDGILPAGHYALAEQHAGRMLPDLLTLNASGMPAVGPSPALTGA